MNLSERELQALLRTNGDLTLVTNGERTTVQPMTVVDKPKPAALEFALQSNIIAQANLRGKLQPDWLRLYAVPNGQYRQGQRMEPGTRKGHPDLVWPLPRGMYHGLVIELKIKPNDCTREQLEWLAWYRKQGWCALVVYDDIDKAMQALEAYYNGAEA